MTNNETHFQLLRLLANNAQLSQRQVAQELGLSIGKANYCLRALIDKGWVKAHEFRRSDNKWAYAYVLTPSGVRAKVRATLGFLQIKQSEFNRLTREIKQLEKEARAASVSQTVARIKDMGVQ